MKRTLALLAALFMVATPLTLAMANEEMAPAAEAPAAASGHEVMLKDGTMVKIDAEGMAWTVGADGTPVAATDGDHVLADDTVLRVEGGKVTAGLPEAAPAEGEAHHE